MCYITLDGKLYINQHITKKTFIPKFLISFCMISI
jgi:hypothetical protein